MNEWIQEIAQQGRAQEFYNIAGNIGVAIAALYGLWLGRRLGIPLWKTLIVLVAVHFSLGFVVSNIWKILEYIRDNQLFGIKRPVNSIVRGFLIVPLIAFLVAKLLRLKARTVWDTVAMYLVLRSGLCQLPCLFTGCCTGYPWRWGVYNCRTEDLHFPVPILETLLSLAIFFWLLYRLKKNDFRSDGTYFPIMLVLYGIMRFICECLRDNEKLFWACSAVAIHAIILSLVGVIWLSVAYKRNKKTQKVEIINSQNT